MANARNRNGDPGSEQHRLRHLAAFVSIILAASSFATWAFGVPLLIATGHTHYVESISHYSLVFASMFCGIALAFESGLVHFTISLTKRGFELLAHSERKQYRNNFKDKLEHAEPTESAERAEAKGSMTSKKKGAAKKKAKL